MEITAGTEREKFLVLVKKDEINATSPCGYKQRGLWHFGNFLNVLSPKEVLMNNMNNDNLTGVRTIRPA